MSVTNRILMLLLIVVSFTQAKSRKKRYVTFPEGSTYTFAFCMTIKALTFGDVDVFTEAVAAAVNYDLPSNITQLPLHISSVQSTTTKHPIQNKYSTARAQRALIYSKAENILDAIGMDGRSCILKTLCESVQLLSKTGNFIHQLLRIIFTIPIEMMAKDESNQLWQYRAAQISGLQYQDCTRLFQRCPISLLSLALSLRPHEV